MPSPLFTREPSPETTSTKIRTLTTLMILSMTSTWLLFEFLMTVPEAFVKPFFVGVLVVLIFLLPLFVLGLVLWFGILAYAWSFLVLRGAPSIERLRYSVRVGIYAPVTYFLFGHYFNELF